MRLRRLDVIVAGIGFYVVSSAFNAPYSLAASVQDAFPPSATQSEDEKSIRRQAQDFATAFAAGDATAIAKQWTEDGTLVEADGQKYDGRDAISKVYQSFFKENGAQPITINIQSLTFPAANVCLEEGTSGLTRDKTAGGYSVVHLKRDGIWKMFRVIETPVANVPEHSPSLKDMSWLIGDWSAKNADKAVRLHVEPLANGKFLTLKYMTASGDHQSFDDLQLIGLNSRTQKIVSWHFGGNGGFGFGSWSQNGSDWINKARGVMPNGGESAASYIFHKEDGDHLSWRSVGRVVDGTHLPDSSVVEATRVAPDASTKTNAQ